MSGAKLTLQKILQLGYAAYERHHPLPDYVRRAVWALLACRTAGLGGHIQACPEGHVERVWYNSCRHRFCPPCAWVQIERWLAQQRARLLACDHDHVIFTMPDELRGLWLANVRPMTNLLFAPAHETLDQLLGDAQYLGACPGLIAALHTWSQTLVWHPHRHCLVTGGGLTDAGQWRPVRHGFLLPVRVVMAVCRGKLLAVLGQGLAHDQLRLPEGRSRQQMETLLNKWGRTKWNVHMRERYPHGVGVLIYLARYIRGGSFANQRLVACEQGMVTFRYRLNGEEVGETGRRQGRMQVSIEEFIRRDLLHVPPPGIRVVRCYGLYAPTQGAAVASCRAQLGQEPLATPAVLDWQMLCQDRGEGHPERCPQCGRRLVRRGLIPRSRIPPPGAGASEQAA